MSTPLLNEVIYAPNRLKICAFLAPLELAEFRVLRDELDVSDSVLSKHVKQLENAGYVRQRKGSANGRKRSWLQLTAKGRRAFKQYVDELRDLVSYVDP
ncbi:MAG TPA: MarR family transcriptional regulator [Gemmatimonadetes bacterium]|nr:MarR family transcriptional regulator [Gemmatimonadota bacterium]